MRRIIHVAAAALLLASAIPHGATASETPAGVLAVQGTASLPSFPCIPGCSGTFNGTIHGAMGGLVDGVPWTAEIVTGPISTVLPFTYNDSCTQVGFAGGTVTFSAAAGNLLGTYGPVPGSIEFAKPVVGLSGSATFSWLRVGLNAVITVTDFDVSLTVITSGTTSQTIPVITNRPVQALAVFVPLDVPTCDPLGNQQIGPQLDAQVVATVAVH